MVWASYTRRTAHPIVQLTVLSANILVLSGQPPTIQSCMAHTTWLCTCVGEYKQRYGKEHTCLDVIYQAERYLPQVVSTSTRYGRITQGDKFTRAMPEYIKYNDRIEYYRGVQVLPQHSPWLATNYLRIPSRKPSFIITTHDNNTKQIRPTCI